MFFIILFLRQWLVVELLLVFINRGLRQNCRFRRIAAAAAAGSLAGCAAMVFPGRIFFFILGFALTVQIAFGSRWKKKLYFGGCLAALAALYGGIWTACKRFIPGKSWMLGGILSAAGLFCFYILFWRDTLRQKDFLYDVEFTWQGKIMHVPRTGLG